MYDNLPFKTNDLETIKAFLNSELLVFQNESIKYDTNTGEEIRTTYFKYINLTFTVRYNREGLPMELKSKGSFHYLMNNGKHNADNITFKKAKNFLLDFQKLFNVDLKNLVLSPPEFAVNFISYFDVEEIVQNTFYEQRKQFNNNEIGQPSKISGKRSNDYRLKIYSKSHEHPSYCPANTLRLEYQAKKMRGLNRLGIKTVHDLLSLTNWVKIMEMHLSYFRHLVIYDFNIKIPNNSKYKKTLYDLRNPNYWEKLLKNIRKGIEYETKYNDELSHLNYLSKNYGSNLLISLLFTAKIQWINNLGICKEYSVFQIKKPKDAPLFKPKEAPIIVCIPCNSMQHLITLKSSS